MNEKKKCEKYVDHWKLSGGFRIKKNGFCFKKAIFFFSFLLIN